MKLNLKRNERDLDMIEVWSEDNKYLWCIIHADAFIDMFDGYANIPEEFSVNVTEDHSE